MSVSVEYFVAARSPPYTGHSLPACAACDRAANDGAQPQQRATSDIRAVSSLSLGSPRSISCAERSASAQNVSVAFAQLPRHARRRADDEQILVVVRAAPRVDDARRRVAAHAAAARRMVLKVVDARAQHLAVARLAPCSANSALIASSVCPRSATDSGASRNASFGSGSPHGVLRVASSVSSLARSGMHVVVRADARRTRLRALCASRRASSSPSISVAVVVRETRRLADRRLPDAQVVANDIGRSPCAA